MPGSAVFEREHCVPDGFIIHKRRNEPVKPFDASGIRCVKQIPFTGSAYPVIVDDGFPAAAMAFEVLRKDEVEQRFAGTERHHSPPSSSVRKEARAL